MKKRVIKRMRKCMRWELQSLQHGSGNQEVCDKEDEEMHEVGAPIL